MAAYTTVLKSSLSTTSSSVGGIARSRYSSRRSSSSSSSISYCSIAFPNNSVRKTNSGSGRRLSTTTQQAQQQFISTTRGRAITGISRVLTEEESQLKLDTNGGSGDGVSGNDKGGSGGGGGGDANNNEDDGDINNNKKKMSMSQKLTLGYAALIGVGGIMGYVKSGSQKSLAAGGLSALILYYVYTALPVNPFLASFVGFGLSAALLGVMGSRFKSSGKIFPAGVVSLVSLIMTGGYLHGIMRGLHA